MSKMSFLLYIEIDEKHGVQMNNIIFDIASSVFKERGLNDWSIENLGECPDDYAAKRNLEALQARCTESINKGGKKKK